MLNDPTEVNETPPAETRALPVLAVERFSVPGERSVRLASHISVARLTYDHLGSLEPDGILIMASGKDCAQHIGISPAMLVHMANTMLTDTERAAICTPAGVAS